MIIDWTQTLVIVGPILAAVYTFYQIISTQMNKIEANHREDMKRSDDKWQKLDDHHREEMKDVRNLWAHLLKEIHDIKLFQVTKDQPKS
jgi:hypothetical protein